MSKYMLLYMMLGILLLTWSFASQIQGGLRFSGNKKLIVKKTSIVRKFLLRKKNRDYPLEIYKVIPWAITFVLFCIVIALYALHAILYTFPIGMAIGAILESNFAMIFGLIWYLLVGVYIGVINAL